MESRDAFLGDMGVALFEPDTRRDFVLAEAMEAFASFCLEKEPAKCNAVIQKHVDMGTAGSLQGGSDDFEIYRLSIDGESTGQRVFAGNDLLQMFLDSSSGKQYKNALTIQKIKRYMLDMCDRFVAAGHSTRKYTSLENLMFVLSFGPIEEGQVRHIDDMDPNVQICLYMSRNCPSTVIYSKEIDEDFEIACTDDLLCFWRQRQKLLVPPLLVHILSLYGDVRLRSRRHTKYFQFWNSINSNLVAFGKLYLPVQSSLMRANVTPGTTMVAANNQVHGGPSTRGPRMFAFAVGVPDDISSETENRSDARLCQDKDNVGEIQYSPVLLHLDLCCIIFSLMDFEKDLRNVHDVSDSKTFLLNYLVELIKDGGSFYRQSKPDVYDRMFAEDRHELRDWLGSLVKACMFRDGSTGALIGQVVTDSSIFHTPDMCLAKRKRRIRIKKQRQASLERKV